MFNMKDKIGLHIKYEESVHGLLRLSADLS